MVATDLLRQAIEAARAGRTSEARSLFMQVVDQDSRNEIAWIWLTGLMDSLEDRIIACENALTINPANYKVRMYLEDLLRQREAQAAETVQDDGFVRETTLSTTAADPIPDPEESRNNEQETTHAWDHPLDRAAGLESEGKFDQALQVYAELASRTKNPREFDHIFAQIARIEGLQKERIRHVSAAASILRLSLAWLSLYLILVLVQAGLNPFRNPSLPLWFGVPLVAVGSFCLSLVEFPDQHVLWKKVFSGREAVPGLARWVAGVIGWVLILLPHALLIMDSIHRLDVFQIPARPLF